MLKLLTLFIGTNLINPFLSLYHHHQIQTNKTSWLSTNEFKTVMKQTSIVGEYKGSEYKTEQNVAFKTKFKDVYLSSNKANVKFDFLLSNLKQVSPINNDNKNYGGIYELEHYAEIKKNVQRIQDWTTYYKNNLSFDMKDLDNNFGVCTPKLLVNSDLVLKKGRINSNNLKSPVAFATTNEKQIIINDPHNFSSLVYKNGVESTIDFNGLPFTFYRESTNKKMFMLLGHGFFYALDASTNISNKHKIVPFADNTYATINNYRINNLISITNSSYKNKVIQLGINKDLITRAKKLHEKHNQTLQSILPKLKNSNINMVNMFVNRNVLGTDNIDNFISHSNKFDDALNWLNNNESNETNYARELGFLPHDNPYHTLNNISKKLTFNICYQISDTTHPDQWSGKMMSCSYQNLLHGINLNLNPNQANEYKFKLISIKSNEINDDQCYIQNDETNEISNESSNVKMINGVYTLEPIKILDIYLKPNDSEFNKNYFTHELSDKLLINKYLFILTNYLDCNGFELLDSSNYKIKRKELLGSIEIEITFNNKQMSNTYYGFKKANAIISDINGSLEKYHLIADDLNEKEIKLLLQLNGLNSYIVNALHFSIQKIDDLKGEAEICITDCDDDEIKNEYLNKTFRINHMQPYFIKQKNKLSTIILNKKLADVTIDDVKNDLLDASAEFKYRNYDNLNIKLTPSHNKLIVDISYYDSARHDLKFTYKWFKKSVINNFSIWWIVTGVASIIAALIIGYNLWRKLKSKQSLQTIDDQQV